MKNIAAYIEEHDFEGVVVRLDVRLLSDMQWCARMLSHDGAELMDRTGTHSMVAWADSMTDAVKELDVLVGEA